MKYLVQNWEKEHDCILFFFQRLEEMLFHYSGDIVRMPVYNTKMLLLEYITVEKEVVQKRIGDYQLEQIFNELVNNVENDKILRDYFGDLHIDYIVKSMKKDRRQTIHYLNNQISSHKYLSLAVDYIKKHVLMHNHKNEVEFGIRAWITMIVCMGYSADYVYNYMREILSARIENPKKCFMDFIDSFVLKDREFKVYFSFLKHLEKYKTLMMKRLKITFEENKNIKISKKETDFMGYFIIKSYDNYSAMKKAYERLNIFIKFYRVISNNSKQFIRNFGAVIDLERDICIKIPVKPLGYKSIEIEPQADLTKIVDKIILNCQKKDTLTYTKLNRMIDLHNDAIQQLDLKDGFLSLWSILEMVGLDINSESKIDGVINNLTPVLQKDYFSNVFSNISGDLRDNLDRDDYANLLYKLGYSKGTLEEEYIAKFIFFPEFEELREEYFGKLEKFPVIRNKIYNLWNLRRSKNEIFRISQKYIKRVKWHIYRLYRTRNSIVHTGKVEYGLKMLGEHLHIYTDAVITDIITKLALRSNLRTINDVLLDAKLIMINIEDSFSKGDRITDSEISLLCKDIVYI
ncbi:MAG: hypothetical protein HFI90_02875 [Clostridia bacterium]|nr:hypothetical protein [Clostridia bacterium]